MISIYFITVLLLFQDQPKPLPALQPFLAELRKNLHTDRQILSQYTYTEKQTRIQLDSDQKPKKTEIDIFEVFPGSPERVGYRRQIVKDGAPLSAAELQKKDQEMQKRRAEIQRKIDQRTPAEKQKARAERDRREQQILDDVFGVFEPEIIGRENLEGRDVIHVKFKPRLTYKPKTREGNAMQHMAGQAWISEDDHQIARVELEVIEPISFGLGILAKLQKGASILAERRKFNDEIWLPVKIDVTVNARLLLVKGFNIRQIVEYSDHKKYSVDTILSFPDIENPEPR